MTILYAQPYNIDACGFNFASVHIFNAKVAKCFDAYGSAVEEFELQYLDGDDGQLFEACRIHQGDLATWFDDIETLDRQEKAALFYLVDQVGYRLNEALEKLADVRISECSLIDAATQLFDDCYLSEVPEAVRNYIDYDAFANDCSIGGDMCEFRFDGDTYTCINASGV